MTRSEISVASTMMPVVTSTAAQHDGIVPLVHRLHDQRADAGAGEDHLDEDRGGKQMRHARPDQRDGGQHRDAQDVGERMIRRSGRPKARAMRTWFSPMTSSIEARTIRAI